MTCRRHTPHVTLYLATFRPDALDTVKQRVQQVFWGQHWAGCSYRGDGLLVQGEYAMWDASRWPR